MKRFQFRLQRVQKLRERVREERQLAHAEAVAFQQQTEDQLLSLQRLRAAEQLSLRQSMEREKLSVEKVIQGRNFDHRLIKVGLEIQRRLLQIQQVVAARREELVVAEREVKMLEKLEERQRQRYDRALSLAEQVEMDEMALKGLRHRPETDSGQ